MDRICNPLSQQSGRDQRRRRIRQIAVVISTLVAIVAFKAPAAHALEFPPSFGLVWGGAGTGAGQFTGLEFLASDSAGNVYAADAADYVPEINHRVQKFSPDGVYLGGWGGFGTGVGQFTRITGMSIDRHDVVWTTETYLTTPAFRVQKFTTTGTPLGEVPWLTFNNLFALAFDSSTDDVFAISSDPAFVRRFNSSGVLLNQFNVGALPRSGVVDAAGNLFLALNRGNGPVVKYSPTGTVLATIDMSASQLGIDDEGNLYGASTVTGPNVDTVSKVSPAGEVLARWGGTGTAPGQFVVPTGLAITAAGRVYIGEYTGHRIQRFAPRDTTPPTIAASVTGGTLGTNGWYVSDVTVHFTCTDTGSGIPAGACPADQSLST